MYTEDFRGVSKFFSVRFALVSSSEAHILYICTSIYVYVSIFFACFVYELRLLVRTETLQTLFSSSLFQTRLLLKVW